MSNTNTVLEPTTKTEKLIHAYASNDFAADGASFGVMMTEVEEKEEQAKENKMLDRDKGRAWRAERRWLSGLSRF